jgi:hypothetical protein
MQRPELHMKKAYPAIKMKKINIYSTRYLIPFVLLLFSLNLFAQPSISSFAPLSGPVGTTVTINGIGFSALATNNIVYFGAVRANVTAANSTSLTVTVPSGATYQPISVTVNGLIAPASRAFNITFTGGGQINSTSFSSTTDFTTDLHPNAVVVADLDGDGKPDIATPNNYSISGQPASISILRNISNASAISFAPAQNINNGVLTYTLAAADIDGDGKQDLAACSIVDQVVSVFRNTSTPGSISFAPKVNFTTNTDIHGITICDIDGDGKPEISVVSSLSGITSVLRNTSSPGSISFALKVDFATLIAESIVSSDFDGDGKADLAITSDISSAFSIFRNTSSPGSISFAARNDISCGSGNQPHGITTGDLDGDGKSDLAVVITNSTISGAQVYRNTSTLGNINFSFSTSLLGTSGSTSYHTTMGDINGDGKPDIAVTSGAPSNQVRVFQNNSTSGAIIFGEGNGFNSLLGPYGIACCDLDADSKPDIAVSAFTLDKISVLKNKCGSPEIFSFTPNTAAAGATVTLSGTNFTGINSVSFGTIPASSFTVVNANTITAVVGTGASGDVMVSNSIGSGSISGFKFAGTPIVSSFTPTSGFSGTVVTISGLNFNGATVVSFGGIAATSFNIIDPFTIIATVDIGATGSVSVTTPYGTGSLGGFTYAPVPIIAGFSPTSAASGSTVTINGINFTGTIAVSFGGVAATSFTVVNGTTITAVVANGASGNVVVTNSFGSFSAPGFTYVPPPVVTSFNPSSAGGGTTVVITGTNFNNVLSVKFGGRDANSFTVVNPTTINAIVSSGGASGTVSVTTSGGTGSLAGFTFIPAPSITSFSPAFTGSGATVAITGTNLSGATAVSFGGVAASSFTVINSTTIAAIVGNGASGNVTVTTRGGSTLQSGFTYITTPIIHSFSPASGPVGTVVTITGADFNPIATSNIVYFGAVKATVSSGTANSLMVTVPVGANYQPISVTANNLTAFSFNPFTVTYAGGGAFNPNSFAGRTDFVTAGKPENIVSGDLDGDGKPDVVVANSYSNTISIFRNTSTATSLSFAPKIDSAAGVNPHAVRIADIDGDGKLDIIYLNYNIAVVTNGSDNTISIFRNTSTPGNIAFASRNYFITQIGPQIIINPYDLAVTDLNLDGKPDLAVIHTNTYTPEGNPIITTYSNGSSGSTISFIFPQQFDIVMFPNRYFPNSISAADINLDSKPDLVVTTAGGGFLNNSVVVMRNQSAVGSVGFNLSTQIIGTCVSTFNQAYPADFDGDGKIDIITDDCFFRNTTSNANDISFESQTNSGLGGILAIDGLSGSIKPDFARVNSATNTVSAVRNTSTVGLVSFDPGVNYNTGTNPGGVSIADFNGDGKVDIATSNKDFNTFSVLLNTTGFSGPSITSFSPTNGTSGTAVTITGSNFKGVAGVSFGGVAASSFTVVNSTTITATVSTGTSGNISITTASGTATMGWFYFAPSIASFTPAIAGTGLSVTITGTGFIGVTNVSFGGISASSFTIVSPTTIVAVVAAGSTGDVSVTSSGGTATLSGFIYALAPAVNSFSPMNGGTGTVVIITGTNFSGATQVTFGGASASSFTVISPTSISAVVGGGATGNVFVTTPGGTANSINQFFTFIPAPIISSFTPISATTGATVTISGSNFSGATVVNFGDTAASSFTVNSSTNITAVVGAGATGDVSVTTPGGIATLAGFTFTVVTAIDPVPASSLGIRFYPNPTTGSFVIDTLKLSDKWETLEIFDAQGKKKLSNFTIKNKTRVTVNVEYLSNGLYMAILKRKNGPATVIKFLKL